MSESSEIKLPIVFSYPKDANPSTFMTVWAFGFLVAMIVPCVRGLLSTTDAQTRVILLVITSLLSVGLLFMAYALLSIRRVSVYENYIEEKYLILFFLNKKYGFEDCVGYSTFSKQSAIPKGRYASLSPTTYFSTNGIRLKYKNQSHLTIVEVSKSDSNYESIRIHAVQGLLDKKRIQYIPG